MEMGADCIILMETREVEEVMWSLCVCVDGGYADAGKGATVSESRREREREIDG